MNRLTYMILTFCFLVVLTCHYTPLIDPVVHGDGAHYRAMAMGEQVPQPFMDRIFLSTIIGWLADHIDIASWTYVIDNLDAWFFVWTFMCLWITGQLVYSAMRRFGISDDSASLAGFLYLSTFWLTGYQLSNPWLQDPFVNMCVWLGIYLWSIRWYYGMLGLMLAITIKGGVLGYNWAVISHSCSFYSDIPQILFAFGFLWLAAAVADKRLLAILALVFIAGRIVTCDVARACVAVFSFPVMLGVAWITDRYLTKVRWRDIIMMAIFLIHLYQQSTWLFAEK